MTDEKTKSETKKLALIGCGARLRNVVEGTLRAAPAGSIEISDLYDPDPGSVAAARKLAPGAVCHNSVDGLLGRSGAGWVAIGSPNSEHASQAVAALDAGRHVFCEKPLATSVDDCARIRDAVLRNPERIFFFGLVLRYSPFYRRIKQLLDAGEIGKIISFEFNETLSFFHGGYIHGNWRRHRAAAGTHVLEKCCHDLDIANWLTGSFPRRAASFGGLAFFTPENRFMEEKLGSDDAGRPAYKVWADPHGISPFNEDKDIVDHQVAILEYRNGVKATFHTNCHAGLPERRFYICGADGSLRCDVLTAEIEIQKVGFNQNVVREVIGEGDGHAGADTPMQQALASSILTGSPPSAGLDEGLKSSLAAFAIDEALDKGCVVDTAEMSGRLGI
jgi:predicted dehydrogenase